MIWANTGPTDIGQPASESEKNMKMDGFAAGPRRVGLGGAPLLSIVVPVKNEAANLRMVLPELPSTHEVILVDGGSIPGLTEHLVTPEIGVRAVDGLITGLHEPRSSHLMMLTAIAGTPLLSQTYEAALDEGYLWHEFGDLNLLLP
jgi:hypothetical protein